LGLGTAMRHETHRRDEHRRAQQFGYHLNGTYPRYTATATCAATMTSCR
jgi:hypothetical protein